MNLPAAEDLSFEAQASACLLAATHHRARLLAVATKLTGSAEAGMDLFQQTCLDCHDAIQRRGFQGTRYEFYLLTSLKHLHYKWQGERQRTRSTDFQARQDYGEAGSDDEPTTAARLFVPAEHLSLAEAPQTERQLLAEQVAAEVRARLSFAERLVLRLHADGYSSQEIVELTGATGPSGALLNRRRMHEHLERLKAQLRRTFGQAWQALLD